MIQAGQSFGKFYLLDLLGQGGTSRVFKALQQPINRIIALKIPDFSLCRDLLSPDEFLAEAMTMGKLDHAHIVRIYDFGVEDGQPFLCMEYVEGPDVVGLVERGHPLPDSVVLAVLAQTLSALRYAHSLGVTHRDLSPKNMLVSPQGQVKLSDFGMAGRKGASRFLDRVVGTPSFLSPEHVRNQPCTPASDAFSLGAVAYYLACGKLLFDPGPDGQDLAAVFEAIAGSRNHPPDQLHAMPAHLRNFTRMALQGADLAKLEDIVKALWKEREGERETQIILLAHLQSGAQIGYQELRRRYLRLRESGDHKAAVELLESALARDPGNPRIQDLLLHPLAKPETGLQTIQADGARRKRGRAFHSTWITILAALALFLGWRLYGREWLPAPRRHPAGVDAPPSPQAAPAAPPAPATIPVAPTVAPTPAPEYRPTSRDAAPKAQDRRARTRPPEAGAAGAKSAPIVNPITNDKPAAPAAAAPDTASPGARPAPRGAAGFTALILSEPKGVTITVNDTLRLVSPSPPGGWRLSPGLISFVLNHPGFRKPISSTLYLSADTSYSLQLNRNGGYAVLRTGL